MAKKKQRKKKVLEVSDRILEKIGQAVDELNYQVLKEVTKEKETFYENEDFPKKATREITRETEVLNRVESTVDREGLKQLITALKNVQEVQQAQQEDGREAETMAVILERELDNYAC